MSGWRKPTKGELVLLGLTAVFLCALAGLSAQDRAAPEAGAVIETEVTVPREEIAPDFPPVNLNTAGVEELDSLPASGRAWPAGSSPGGRPTGPLRISNRSWR